MRGAKRQRLAGPEARRDEVPGRPRYAAVSEATREEATRQASATERQTKADRPGGHRRRRGRVSDAQGRRQPVAEGLKALR